jgi:hypothetical protein
MPKSKVAVARPTQLLVTIGTPPSSNGCAEKALQDQEGRRHEDQEAGFRYINQQEGRIARGRTR